MLIDNSQMKAFQTCPYLWYEKYVKGVELDWERNGPGAAQFGTRMHEMLEEYYHDLQGSPIAPYPEHPNAPIEMEAQLTMAQYRNHYPVESFAVLDVEKTFRVPLGKHEYVGKFDVVFREDGLLGLMDHKSQKRQAYSNTPKAWASRTQATLYLWAAEQVYGEKFDKLVVNVLRRQSDKGQVGPEFSRQTIQRSAEQIELAVRGLEMIADQISHYQETFTEVDWAMIANRNACMNGNFECDFYAPHLMGWSDDLLRLYKPTVPYLDL